MYLERGEFELAKEYCRVMLNMVTVLVVQNGFVFSADANNFVKISVPCGTTCNWTF